MQEYNDKSFLLPDSIRSCASYHAKVFYTGEYMFRIHDCVTGIRLRGELTTPQGMAEAKGKIRALIEGLERFEEFLNEVKTPFNHDKE